MEHNLGMTCDPIGGLVQIPCIERNGMGAVKAVNASRLAMSDQGSHKISLRSGDRDDVPHRYGYAVRYKETSLAGLAHWYHRGSRREGLCHEHRLRWFNGCFAMKRSRLLLGIAALLVLLVALDATRAPQRRVTARLYLGAVRVLSTPIFGHTTSFIRCRYNPTCSRYSISGSTAFCRIAKGLGLRDPALRRAMGLCLWGRMIRFRLDKQVYSTLHRQRLPSSPT